VEIAAGALDTLNSVTVESESLDPNRPVLATMRLRDLASGMLRAPLRRSVHINPEDHLGGTICSGTYVLPCTVSRRTQRSAKHISLQSPASTITTRVLRLDPNNSLQGADAIVSFGTRSFQLQHAQTLVSYRA